MAANLGQVQGKSALVTAHVQRAPGCAQPSRPLQSGCIVGALIKKCARLLPGVGVEDEIEAVEMELGADSRSRCVFDK